MTEKKRILDNIENDNSRPVLFSESHGGSESQLRLLFKYVPDEYFKDINLISKIGGIILLITGILILTNQLQAIGFYIIKFFPFMQNFG